MEEMSYLEKSRLPYSLLLDPQTDRAAAYTNNHRLITPNASAKLVAFAKANRAHEALWDESKYEPNGPWRPLPDWATPEVRARFVLIWIKRGSASDEYFASIPKK
jgi:hypothetical protein